MTQLCSVRKIVVVGVMVALLIGVGSPASAAGREGRNATTGAQLFPIVVGCGAYSLGLGYSQYHSKTLPPMTGNSGVVYFCGIAGADVIILESVLDPFNQQLSSDIYQTLNGIESVHSYFFEQEGISQFDYKARCDLTIESGCPMNAQYEVAFTISAYTAEDFCGEEWCICRENYHCDEGLVCRPFFTEFANSHGECVRAEWWLD